VVIERQGGLGNIFVIILIVLWYLFSAFTLYLNKYIVGTQKVNPNLVGTVQMVVTCVLGFAQLKKTEWKMKSKNQLISTVLSEPSSNQKQGKLLFLRNMIIIGLLRLFSIVLGLMALRVATISFVETIKSSSPVFTVVISHLMIGEITGYWTKMSLIPIILGLALCSSFELNFSMFGLLAALLTNFTECLQNVFSKFLLCSDSNKFTPVEVQFYSSATSVAVLAPLCYMTISYDQDQFQMFNIFIFLLNGICFHCQSLLAFTVMSYISPVTHSVCNTLKRALLIWLSVFLFKNKVGWISAFGTIFVIAGVLCYIQAKNIDKNHQTANSHKK
jgi:solute carrier family 35 protein E2